MEPFVIKGGPVGRDVNIWRNLMDDVSQEHISEELTKGLHYIQGIFG